MKALFFREHGTPAKLSFGDLPDPVPGNDEVVIKVKACAINHLDLWILEGWPGLKLKMPHIGGADIAGEVAHVGSHVSPWKVGARVVVNPGVINSEDEWTRRGEDSVSPGYGIIGETRPGGFAQYVAVPEKNLATLPVNIDYVKAASSLLVGVTSWRMLKIRAGLQAGETVLIVGAGGGVNSFSIQLARHLGAEVIALSSSDAKLIHATKLGARDVINYKKYPDWSRVIRDLTKGRGVDVVIDNVGAKTLEQSIRSVRRGGRIVTVGNTSGATVSFDNRLIFTKQISLIGSTMGSRADFEEVTKLIWAGKIQPVIDCELPLQEGKRAYERLAAGEQFGKVVLLP